ncbi:MAG: Gfo/Idh/MocA family oxidoreductase [Capsulimonas sp.]|uniref:Gfo/Idh/MocA family protein n=1 Tax=Capsulimonas sp. TaxID=2494211 RepID=UPI003262DDD2
MSFENPVRIGIIGCGNISASYLKTFQNYEAVTCVAVADIDPARAQARAEEFGVPKATDVDGLLADPDVEIVVNLTTPQAHYAVTLAAIKAGKHVYNEKPLTVTIAEAREALDAAEAAGVRVGCAPGTFLGGGLQTCRQLIDQGAIGRPAAATAFMLCHGHESWHPDPEFYYKIGGGPMMDMGPYYLTALISLLGGIKRVSGAAAITETERTITSQPKNGTKMTVETPDHVAGTIQFQSGAIGTIITSFAIWHASYPNIQIFGTEGTLTVPDPNSLRGPVYVQKVGESERHEVPLTHNNSEGDRWGIGVVDLAYAIRSGRPHRASGALAFQVLSAMHGFLDSAKDGQAREINGAAERPAPLPSDLPDGVLDA